MIKRVVIVAMIVPIMAYGMDLHHKKRSVEEALDSGTVLKKRLISTEVLQQFEAAVAQHNIAGARQVLIDNHYQPKHLSLSEAIRVEALPDFIHWLGAQRNAHPEDDSFSTALHTATAYGNTFFMQLLLYTGAEVNGRNAGGWTPLHFAVWHGRTAAMVFLLDNGADTSAKIVNEHTPLYNIIRYYNLDHHGFPNPFVKTLIMQFISHAQFNPHKTLAQKAASRDRRMAFLLSLQRNNARLPVDIRRKIAAYLPEDINSHPLFCALFSHIEHDSQVLTSWVEYCPFACFKAACAAKNTPLKRQLCINTLAPMIVAYRTRKLPELLPALEPAQQLYPGTQGPQAVALQCIEEAIEGNLILKTVIDILNAPSSIATQ